VWVEEGGVDLKGYDVVADTAVTREVAPAAASRRARARYSANGTIARHARSTSCW
jgi:hypothetical protein